MSNVNRDDDLSRLRSLILATIEYHIAGIEKDLSDEQHEIVIEYYSQQKYLVEKYFQKRRLDRLQQKLRSLIKMPQSRGDRQFSDFIKEKTKYEIDIFQEIQERIDLIINAGEIANRKELNDVGTFFNAFGNQPEYQAKVESLKTLLRQYIELKPHKVIRGISKNVIIE